MLETIIQLLRWIHIPTGIAGFAIFWVPLFLRKGGKAHRRAGWAFVACMAPATITAAALSIARLVEYHQSAGGLTLQTATNPLFLLNISLLTGASIFHALRVLRQKGRVTPHTDPLELILPSLLFLSSASNIALGFKTGQVLLYTLPTVGLFLSVSYLVALLRKPKQKMFWWFQHMIGMFAGCIAAITAALVVNGERVQRAVSLPGWLLWIGPTLILVPALIVWIAYYKRKFASAKGNQIPSPAT